jgi:hypothetical protein
MAYGLFQIHQIMVDDYNRITGDTKTHQDAFDPEISRHIAYTVLSHYKAHIERLNKPVTTDHLLFIWNGGGGAWIRVHHPKNDQKQKNLIRYKNRATPIIIKYINEQAKRRKPKEGAQV